MGSFLIFAYILFHTLKRTFTVLHHWLHHNSCDTLYVSYLYAVVKGESESDQKRSRKEIRVFVFLSTIFTHENQTARLAFSK